MDCDTYDYYSRIEQAIHPAIFKIQDAAQSDCFCASTTIRISAKSTGERGKTDLPNTNVDELIAFMEENCR